MNTNEIKELEVIANRLRQSTFDILHTAKTGHTGGDLSSVEILTTLYFKEMNIDPKNPDDPNRDRYIQSKGHAAEIMWATLAEKGFFEKEELKTISKFGSRLLGHPNNQVPGVEMNTGSLGHGLSIATGIALAGKMDNKDYKTYVLIGDGELAEGSNWEAGMAAAHYKLSNLTGIIDNNGLQITGTNDEVMSTAPLVDKWTAFGWYVIEVDGHSFEELIEAIETTENGDKPKMIIAHTVKGKGFSLAENQVGWHNKVPNDDEYALAKEELTAEVED